MANTYLKRTNGTPTNAQKGTFSAWVKKSGNGNSGRMIMNFYNGDNYSYFRTHNDDFIQHYAVSGASVVCHIKTNRKLRDCNSWYHIMLVVDTTQSTASDRVKIYINGVQETSLLQSDYPSQNINYPMFIASGTNYHTIASAENGTDCWNGIMSHVHYCDGTALAPTVFGSTDSTTGEWKINTSPSFTLGNNGYTILKDGNTITDQSSNSNDFTLGGGTLTKTEDNPSNVFCTLNPLTNQGSYTFAHGNTYLEGNNTNSWTKGIGGTLAAKSGKYYWEVKQSPGSHTDYNIFGFIKADEVMNTSANLYSSGNMNSVQTHTSTATIYAQTGTYSSYVKINGSHVGISDNDIVSFALDLDNRKCWLAVNGVWVDDKNGYTNGSSINTSYPLWGTGEITADTFYTPANIQYYDPQCYYNFGNGYFGNTQITSEGTNASGIGKFEYNVPTGFTALSTKGLNL